VRILFLAHRAPWPPDKGERIRAFHILRHLAARHEVQLAAHVEPEMRDATERALAGLCAGVFLRPLAATTLLCRLGSGLIRGRALSLNAFSDQRLRRWVRERLSGGIDLVFLYSGAAAEALPETLSVPVIADLVDCDSAKWRDLAARTRSPLWQMLWRREARLVAEAELQMLERAAFILVAAERELRELCALAPTARHAIRVLANGVDSESFDPLQAYRDPYPQDGLATLVFTGAMDYSPNIEAALWFAREVLPRLEACGERVRFAIVGPTGASVFAAEARAEAAKARFFRFAGRRPPPEGFAAGRYLGRIELYRHGTRAALREISFVLR
jgi:glycosyltransferase involved in cell wall biosynthesis